MLRGSQVSLSQDGTREDAKPILQGQSEPTPRERDGQAPEARAEPQFRSLINQRGDPKEEGVFGPLSDNEDEGGEWMEPPRPRRQRKRDRDRGYETQITHSVSARPIAGGTLGPEGTRGQGPSQTGGWTPHPTKKERKAQALTHPGSALDAEEAAEVKWEAGSPLGRAVPGGEKEPQGPRPGPKREERLEEANRPLTDSGRSRSWGNQDQGRHEGGPGPRLPDPGK